MVSSAIVRTGVVVLLVALLVILAIPLGITAAMCPDCAAVSSCGVHPCSVMAASVLLGSLLLVHGIRRRASRPHTLLLAERLTRPPRVFA